MAFRMEQQDCGRFAVFDDSLLTGTDMAISFDDIANLVEDYPEHDLSKLMGEDIGVSAGQPAALSAGMMQATSRDLAPTHQPTHWQPQLLQPEDVSRETQHFPLENSDESPMLPYSMMHNLDLQPVTPLPSSVVPVTSQHFAVAATSPQLFIPEAKVMQAAAPLPCPVQHQEEVAPAHSTTDAAVTPRRRGDRSSRPRKPKVYQMEPQEDKEAEKKRQNAVNAKKHRDMKKELVANLTKELERVTAERDKLQQQVQQLTQTEAQLRLLLANQQCQVIMPL